MGPSKPVGKPEPSCWCQQSLGGQLEQVSPVQGREKVMEGVKWCRGSQTGWQWGRWIRPGGEDQWHWGVLYSNTLPQPDPLAWISTD